MAFEDLLVALRDDQFGKLRCQKPLQPPDPPQFLDLFGDPCFKAAVQFRHFVGPLPQFAEQPRILHRDDRLRSEVLKQPDFLVGEWLYLSSSCADGTKKNTILPQRHPKETARTSNIHHHLR